MKTPRQTAQWKDGQTLFHRTIPATTRDPTSTTSIDGHLKVKDIDYDVGLTKIIALRPACKKSVHSINLFLRYSQF